MISGTKIQRFEKIASGMYRSVDRMHGIERTETSPRIVWAVRDLRTGKILAEFPHKTRAIRWASMRMVGQRLSL